MLMLTVSEGTSKGNIYPPDLEQKRIEKKVLVTRKVQRKSLPALEGN